MLSYYCRELALIKVRVSADKRQEIMDDHELSAKYPEIVGNGQIIY